MVEKANDKYEIKFDGGGIKKRNKLIIIKRLKRYYNKYKK